MKKMGLSCQMGLYVCTVSNYGCLYADPDKNTPENQWEHTKYGGIINDKVGDSENGKREKIFSLIRRRKI